MHDILPVPKNLTQSQSEQLFEVPDSFWDNSSTDKF